MNVNPRRSVEIANQIYADSQVNLAIRLVGARELAGYSDNGRNSGTILDDARSGRIPNVAAWRREVRGRLCGAARPALLEPGRPAALRRALGRGPARGASALGAGTARRLEPARPAWRSACLAHGGGRCSGAPAELGCAATCSGRTHAAQLRSVRTRPRPPNRRLLAAGRRHRGHLVVGQRRGG